MQLPEISEEQNNVLKNLCINNNVIVDSVAGSGKTTCNLHIAKYFIDIKILLLTYNSKLKIETREKAKKLKLENIEVHSYHSFCVKFYDYKCYRDTEISNILYKNKKPIKNIDYDLIVLDEAQDISGLYYNLICKIFIDNSNKNTKICIFGDKNQSIFDFNNADQRFIEYAEELFNFNSYKWIKCNLSISFRVTNEMALFINKCLLGEDRIISKKITNNKPRYIICNYFSDVHKYSRTFEEIKYYLNLGYIPEDIFILAPSIKGNNSPIRLLENKIKRELSNIMIYIPTSDDEKLDEDLVKGKLIFSTFHQTKGLERKVVIIFNFDNSYFRFYNKNTNKLHCTNEIYVATTRGIEHLTLFHDYREKYLDFINIENIKIYCDYEEDKKIFSTNYIDKIVQIDTSVTEMIKYLPQNIIDKCFDKLKITTDNNYIINTINIPIKIFNEQTCESVSEITGVAIPSMFELKIKNKMSIHEKLYNIKYEKKLNLIKKYNIEDININNITPNELLYISNCWNSYKNGYIFKIYQISDYDWLENNKLDKLVDRLSNLNISNNSEFEYRISIENKKELYNRNLIGYIDCFDKKNNIIYEFKCVKNIEKEHYLQLALYMYIHEMDKIMNKNIIKEKLYKNNDIKKYNNGDEIKYINSENKEDTGIIIKKHRTTKNVTVINNKGEYIYLEKNLIIEKNCKIDEVNNKTKYVLFNILTNEYKVIECEIEKLIEIVSEIIYTKYINNKKISDSEFIRIHKDIYKKYF